MAFGAKGKGKPRRANQQNALFKRKKFCRFTVEHVEQIDYKDCVISFRKTVRLCRPV